MTAYLFMAIMSNPGCHCSSYGPSPFEQLQGHCELLAMQSTDEVRDRIMSRLNSEATPA
jgi:hypothetical protein